MPDFSIATQHLPGGIALVDVKGYLDAHTFDQLDKALGDLFKEKVFKVIVKLDELDYISSAGAGVFIGVFGRAQENHGDIVILKPSPNVREVFDLLGLSQIFKILEDLPAAVKAFKQPA
jgi:anti-sigma B factor antagonist